ncbi:hypothetical protein BCE02nite_36030 [Brevibacillus centrosporus]|nr:hypothetical protein BCE02nite_36030 [Brevibacillus centrosporus]
MENTPTAIITLNKLGPSALTIARESRIPGNANENINDTGDNSIYPFAVVASQESEDDSKECSDKYGDKTDGHGQARAVQEAA